VTAALLFHGHAAGFAAVFFGGAQLPGVEAVHTVMQVHHKAGAYREVSQQDKYGKRSFHYCSKGNAAKTKRKVILLTKETLTA
jgi:hypothetical protein